MKKILKSATSFLTATIQKYTQGDGITAAAGTVLALLQLLFNSFYLSIIPIKFIKNKFLAINCHYLKIPSLGNFRACCIPQDQWLFLRPLLRNRTLILRWHNRLGSPIHYLLNHKTCETNGEAGFRKSPLSIIYIPFFKKSFFKSLIIIHFNNKYQRHFSAVILLILIFSPFLDHAFMELSTDSVLNIAIHLIPTFAWLNL